MADQEQNVRKSEDSKWTKGIPRVSLKSCVNFVKKIFEINEGEPVSKDIAFDALGRSSTSGPSRQLLAGAICYGLIKQNGSKLELKQVAKDLVDPNSLPSKRRKAIIEIFYNIEFYSRFLLKYSEKSIPIDKVVQEFFKESFSLNETDTKVLWEILKENLIEYGFTQNLSHNKKLILSRSSMEKDLDSEQSYVEDDKPVAPTEDLEVVSTYVDDTSSLAKKNVSRHTQGPTFNFNIQIQLPENASPEVYEAIFKNISEYLLKNQDS